MGDEWFEKACSLMAPRTTSVRVAENSRFVEIIEQCDAWDSFDSYRNEGWDYVGREFGGERLTTTLPGGALLTLLAPHSLRPGSRVCPDCHGAGRNHLEDPEGLCVRCYGSGRVRRDGTTIPLTAGSYGVAA